MNRHNRLTLGAKAEGLRKISLLNINVPRWTVIPAERFDAWLAPQRAIMAQVVRTLSNDAEACAAELLRLARELPFTYHDTGLKSTALSIFSPNITLSVRSSAVSEDLPTHAFAGAFESCLNVFAPDIPAAIHRVWLSAFSAKAVSYQLSKGFNPCNIRMAVVLQEMVFPQTSGVLFTVNPNGDASQMLLSAVPGLGEGVVGSAVTGDLVYIPRDAGLSPKYMQGHRDSCYAPRRDHTSGIELISYTSEEPLLSNNEIEALKRIGQKLQSAFGSPQDIEWAFDNNRQLYVLQSRSITTLPTGPWTLFDNTNIVENFPGTTTPLTFSWVKRSYQGTFRAAWRALGSRPEDDGVFTRLIGYHRGRIFYNVGSLIEAFSSLFGANLFIKSWQENLGIQTETKQRKGNAANGLFYRFQRFINTIGIHLTLLFTIEKRMEALVNNIAAWEISLREVGTNDAWTAWKLLKAIESSTCQHFFPTILNDAHAFLFSSLVSAIMKRAGHHSANESVAKLLAGDGDLASMLPAKSALRLASMLHSPTEQNDNVKHNTDKVNALREILANNTGREILAALEKTKALTEFYNALREHLTKYSFRKAEELKLEVPNLTMDPRPLLEHIIRLKEYTPKKVSEHSQKADNNPIATIKNPLLRVLVRGAIRLARRAVRVRELGRMQRGRIFDIGRQAFLIIEDGFLAAKVLQNRGDIFFLTMEDLEAWFHGLHPEGSLAATVAHRRTLYAEWCADETSLSRFFSLGTPYTIIPPPTPLSPNGQPNKLLQGISSTPGIAIGEVVLGKCMAENSKIDVRGKIIVAETTDPGWVFYLPLIAGLAIERGSPLSHLAIMAREFGVPTVVGVANLTQLVKSGDHVRLDATLGTVEIQILH